MTIQIAQNQLQKLKQERDTFANVIAEHEAKISVYDAQIAALEKLIADKQPPAASAPQGK
jgi:hypothetical protein